MGAGVAPAAAGHSAAQEGLIEEINAAYGLLRRDPEAWSSLERERRG